MFPMNDQSWMPKKDQTHKQTKSHQKLQMICRFVFKMKTL